MSDIVEEQRVFLFPDGEEDELTVSREGPGLYRVQEFFGFAMFGGLDLPERAGLGWLLDVEELPDGRLSLQRVREDPNVESVSGVGLPEGFSQSAEFSGLTDRIVAAGGNWELFAHGSFPRTCRRIRVVHHSSTSQENSRRPFCGGRGQMLLRSSKLVNPTPLTLRSLPWMPMRPNEHQQTTVL